MTRVLVAMLLSAAVSTAAFGQYTTRTMPTPRELVAPTQTGPMAPTAPSVDSAGPVRRDGMFRYLAPPPAPPRTGTKDETGRRPQ
jgi:hypothetical protein